MAEHDYHALAERIIPKTRRITKSMMFHMRHKPYSKETLESVVCDKWEKGEPLSEECEEGILHDI